MACNILTFPLPIFQWDSNISLDVNASIISEDGHQYVHYQHKGQTEVYSIEVADGKAAIPNIILQTAGAFEAYAYIADDAHGKTLVRTEFTILPRPLPPEYIYDPTPVITYPELVDLVDDLTALRDALSNVSASAETLPAGSAASAEATLSTDGLAFAFGIPQGATGSAGRGIVKIERIDRVGLVDRYQITYTDGTTWNYAVTNGAQGATGATGNGILKIEKVSTVGLVDTYRVTYTSGNTYDYTVTNGADGAPGGMVQGDWTQSDSTADDYIKNKPDITQSGYNLSVGASDDNTSIIGDNVYIYGGGANVISYEINDDSIKMNASVIDFNGSVVSGVGTPADPYDAANKGYVDSALADKMDKANPTGTGALSINRKANTVVGNNSVTLGNNNTAIAANSLATGNENTASGAYSRASGQQSTASANTAVAEGIGVTASGNYSHAIGAYTTAQRQSQHAFGEYNVLDATGAYNSRGDYVEIVGNGTAANARSNARVLDWSGNERLMGDVYVGCAADSTGGSKVAKEKRKIHDVTLTEDTPSTTYTIETDMGGKAFVLSEADVYCFSPVNTGASGAYTGYINVKSAYVDNYNNNYGALTWVSQSKAAINRIHITTNDDLPTLATFSQGNWAETAKTVNVVDAWGATLTTHKQIEGFRIALNQGKLLAGTRIVVFGVDK